MQTSIQTVLVVMPARPLGGILELTFRTSLLGPHSALIFTERSNLPPSAPVCPAHLSISIVFKGKPLWPARRRSVGTQCPHYTLRFAALWRSWVFKDASLRRAAAIQQL